MICYINIAIYVFSGLSLFLFQYMFSSLVKVCFIPVHCHGCLVTLFSVFLYLFAGTYVHPSGLRFVYLSVWCPLSPWSLLQLFYLPYSSFMLLQEPLCHLCRAYSVPLCPLILLLLLLLLLLIVVIIIIISSSSSSNVLVSVIPLYVCFLIPFAALMFLCLLFHVHISALYAITV